MYISDFNDIRHAMVAHARDMIVLNLRFPTKPPAGATAAPTRILAAWSVRPLNALKTTAVVALLLAADTRTHAQGVRPRKHLCRSVARTRPHSAKRVISCRLPRDASGAFATHPRYK